MVVCIHDVGDREAVFCQRVRDDAAMTFPPEGFGAHDRGGPCKRDGFEFGQGRAEFSGSRVIGIVGKGRVPPMSVVFDNILPFAPTAERHHMLVGDAVLAKSGFERFLVKLWVAARAGERSDVDQRFNLMRVQKTQEFIDISGRMTYREDMFRHRLHSVLFTSGNKNG